MGRLDALRVPARSVGRLRLQAPLAPEIALGPASFRRRGRRARTIADDTGFPEMFELLRRQRERWSVRIIPWRNIREVYGVFRRGEILALLVDWPDQWYSFKPMWPPTPVAPEEAAHARAPVVAAEATAGGDGA